MKDDALDAVPDCQRDELVPFLSAAKPLSRLTSEQGRRIKARALETLTDNPLPGFRWRWSTALAAIGLILFGGAAAAAAARYGLLPWARVGRTPDHGMTEKAGGNAHARARARKPAAVEPALASAPELPVTPAHALGSPAGEPARTAPVLAPRAGGSEMKSQRALPTRSMARVDPAPRLALVASQPATFARQPPLAREVLPETPAQRPAVINEQAVPSEATSEPTRFPRQPALAQRAIAEPPAERPTASNEQAVLSEALRRLRLGNDAVGSLALLDQLETNYPASRLALERSNLQVEALLALGRETDALARLDRMAIAALPRSAERYLLRGELRARFQRWQEARDDFERALSTGAGTPSWHERALWGRGVARLRAGDRAGGEADLKRYLMIYPQGRHAAQAERMLAPGR